LDEVVVTVVLSLGEIKPCNVAVGTHHVSIKPH